MTTRLVPCLPPLPLSKFLDPPLARIVCCGICRVRLLAADTRFGYDGVCSGVCFDWVSSRSDTPAKFCSSEFYFCLCAASDSRRRRWRLVSNVSGLKVAFTHTHTHTHTHIYIYIYIIYIYIYRPTAELK